MSTSPMRPPEDVCWGGTMIAIGMPGANSPFPDHEHRWLPDLILDGREQPSGNRLAVHHFHCQECGMRITETFKVGIHNVEFAGPVSLYLHTCKNCGKQYHDGSPFSETRSPRDGVNVKFCSLRCYAETKETWRKEDLTRLIPSLESMVAKATNEVARVLADERLRVIATDEDEPLRSLAREALRRARSARTEVP